MNNRPVQIISLQNERSLKINKDGLKSILMSKSIKNLPVVVVSIVGNFRNGKSFMLNFFLQYLQSTNEDNWIQDVSQTEGFPWRKGIERETIGWLMWPVPFIKKLPNGTKIAIILIDAQGSKDHESSIQECVQLFALSFLVSSIQVINQKNNIQESDLDDLCLFIDYGLAVLKDHSKERPLQKLTFLIRDWDPSDGVRFGFEAGRMLFNQAMEIRDGQTPEMIRIRKNIKSCFSTIECFLMHHPGLNMTENENFTGSLQDMRPKFIADVKQFASSLLKPENLVVKKIGGKSITAKDLFQYIVLYFNQFSNGDMPNVESITTLNSKLSILRAKDEALNYYTSEMDYLTSVSKFVSKLKDKHYFHSAEALKLFDHIRKLGCHEYFEVHKKELKQEINDHFKRYTELNENKKRNKFFCC